jgi:hypothetical protein
MELCLARPWPGTGQALGGLTEILRTKKEWSAGAEGAPPFEMGALRGPSAGALGALATCYCLTPNLAAADCPTVDKAVERLDFP